MTNTSSSLPGLKRILSELGSRSFLEPKALLILVLPSALIFSVFTGQTQSPSDYLIWFAANLFSIPSVVILMLVIRISWQRFVADFQFRSWQVFLISFLLGAIKGYLTGATVIELSGGRLLEDGIATTIFRGGVAGLIGIPVASAVVLVFKDFNRDRNLLLTTKVAQELEKKSSLERQRLERLGNQIREYVEKLKTDQKRQAPKMELDFIRELVDKTVRPLATSMFQDLDRRYPSFAIRQLFSQAMVSQPKALPLALINLSSLPLHISWSGPTLGVVTCLLTSVVVFLVVNLGNLLSGSFRNALTFVLISTVGPTLVAALVIDLVSTQTNQFLGLLVSATFLFGNTSVLYSMALIAFKSAKTNSAEIKHLSEKLDDRSFAVLNKKRKELANQLHGEVQSRLMSLLLRQEAGQKIDRAVAIEELSQISKLLGQGTSEASTLEQSVQKTALIWEGFAEINVTTLETNRDPVVIAELIDEAVSNAFRHGRADRVTISLEFHQLTVADNGIGPTKGKPGIGSQLLDSASREWKLTPGVDGGSVLTVRF